MKRMKLEGDKPLTLAEAVILSTAGFVFAGMIIVLAIP